ncbi:hypothetical protein VHEMI00438 [[Torrubiella] hemipterigena]|uniref:U3 small nucleolar RNA-associated protein 15 C-terminal domain-containing protein n=1 Tax=[Torrubiella] hemipterigena TaxID=1531966 RepID=A0A0A1SQF3_9HYPO|nr:hypothetical protein VHEMI00438 [[Torrubiella] hemipterigena]
MAAQVGPLQQVKLASGPAPITAEQRYWRTFKNQLVIPSPTTYPVTHISSNNDSFAVTTGTRVQIFSTKTRKLLKTITRFSDVARSGEIRQDGNALVAGDDSGRMQVFQANTRSILRTWLTHKQPVWVTKFSPSNQTHLLSASDDRTVRLWDLTNNDPLTTFTGHQDYVRSASYLSGTMSNMIVSGSYDSTVKIWDPRIGHSAPIMTFKHAAPIEAVLPLSTATTIAAASGENITILDLIAAKPLTIITNHQKTVTSLSLASNGQRLVSGGLDGHVKVFETTGWNAVNTIKYPSPILSAKVIATGDENDAVDRHLAVGMQSGMLSVRTRLTGHEANREKQREKEMEALVAGRIQEHDAKKNKRKRRIEASSRLDLAGEGADVTIANDRTGKKKERVWQADLRHGRYAEALDYVVDRTKPDYSPMSALTLLLALRHRGAMRDALVDRNEFTLLPIIQWLGIHVCDPHYVSVCVEACLHVTELYSEYADANEDLERGFRMLRRRVEQETERAQVALLTGSMLESLSYGET